jgi:hypothetical protein
VWKVDTNSIEARITMIMAMKKEIGPAVPLSFDERGGRASGVCSLRFPAAVEDAMFMKIPAALDSECDGYAHSGTGINPVSP